MAYSKWELSVLLQSCGVSGSILQRQHLATENLSGSAHSPYQVFGTFIYVCVKQGSCFPVLNFIFVQRSRRSASSVPRSSEP